MNYKFGLQVSENYRNAQDLKRLTGENNKIRQMLQMLTEKIRIAESELDLSPPDDDIELEEEKLSS